MRNNRINLLVLHLPPPYGGGELQGATLFECFKDRENTKVVLISRKKVNKSTQGRFNLINFLYSFVYFLKIFRNIVQYYPDKIYLSIPKNLLSFLRTSVVIIFCSLIDVKVYGELAGASFAFVNKRKGIIYNYSRFIFKKVNSIRVLGNSLINYAADLGFPNIVVFDNGINVPSDLKVSEKTIHNSKLKMMYAGSLEKSKGISNIIESLSLCKVNNLHFEFTFLGEWTNDDFREKILKRIFDLGLMENIIFRGLCVNERKWQIFTENVLLIHPTYWDGQPMTIIEAMGIGLGIISTKIGAIPDTVADNQNGIILEENTPQHIFNAIEKYYFDRNLLFTVSRNNISYYKKRFSPGIFIKNFQSWLEG